MLLETGSMWLEKAKMSNTYTSESELSSCVRVETAVLVSLSLIVSAVSVDVKQL